MAMFEMIVGMAMQADIATRPAQDNQLLLVLEVIKS